MSELILQNITKNFDQIVALNNMSLEVKNAEFFILLGPTGAGKTTTLRVVAGLEKQDSGKVIFNGECVDDFTPADRDVAIVFQQYSLYPTMSVYDNMAFPLRAPGRKMPEDQIKKRIEETAEKLRIPHLLKRKTAQLSGGEMQRVAIGRVIVRRPRIFLMDEPLSNLDAKLREALRAELQHLQKDEGITTLYVTHDQIEALTMADRIGVLDRGHLIQVGSPEDIYDRPATTFVAKLVGTPRINLLDAVCSDGGLVVKDTQLIFKLPKDINLPPKFVLGVRPEDVKINPNGEFGGQVVLTEPLGIETIVHIKSGEQTLSSIESGLSLLRVNDTVRFDVNYQRLHYFSVKGARLIA